jgi:hypothetical protein
MSAASHLQEYQLFRHIRREDLWCAVPSGHALPQALGTASWMPLDLTISGSGRPPGFDEDAAAYSCGQQGFYVFRWGHRMAPRPRSRVLDQTTGVQLAL